MTTEELIERLAADPRPAERYGAGQRFAVAALAGTVASAFLMLSVFGVRPDIATASAEAIFRVKLIIPLCIAAAALHAVRRLAHPGMHIGPSPLVPAACILALWAACAYVLLHAAPATRAELIFGESWAMCMAGITLLSIPAFAGMTWALKGMAPTRLALAGASAGLFAGGIGAALYAFYCTEMQLPFLAFWNVAGMLIPAAAGAYFGPRLLRW